METLINLLNEFDSWTVWLTEDLLRETGCTYCIICKPYWFIKWLVDNDKIDRDKKVLAFEFSSVYTYDGEDYEDHIKECKLLMLLAIQDKPIEFLISILK